MGIFKRYFINRLKTAPRSVRNFSEKKEFGLDLKAIWLGVMAGLAAWFLAALLGLVWIMLGGSGFYSLTAYVYLAGVAGVFTGGCLAGHKADIRGWLHGLWVGIFLGLFSLVANLEFAPQIFSWQSLGRQLLVWVLWGISGGYLGYYLRSEITRKPVRKRG